MSMVCKQDAWHHVKRTRSTQPICLDIPKALGNSVILKQGCLRSERDTHFFPLTKSGTRQILTSTKTKPIPNDAPKTSPRSSVCKAIQPIHNCLHIRGLNGVHLWVMYSFKDKKCFKQQYEGQRLFLLQTKKVVTQGEHVWLLGLPYSMPSLIYSEISKRNGQEDLLSNSFLTVQLSLIIKANQL